MPLRWGVIVVGGQQVEVSAPLCRGGRGCFSHMCRFGVGGTVIPEPSAANIPLRVFWEKFSVQSGPDSLLGAKIRNIAL